MMTDSWVMAAMTRSAPRRQKGHVAISRANTRSRSLAQLPGRPSRGLRPRALLMALPYPILRCMSRLRSTALRLAPGHTGGAAAPRWARGRSRGEGWPLAGGGGGSGGVRSRGAGAQMPFVFPIRSPMPVLSYVHHLFNVDQCHAYIHTLRWKDRPLQCPQCQSQDVDPWGTYHYRPGCKRYWCNGCKRTFNDLTNTVLHQSKRSLPHWILATFLLCLACSSRRIAREVGVHIRTSALSKKF